MRQTALDPSHFPTYIFTPKAGESMISLKFHFPGHFSINKFVLAHFQASCYAPKGRCSDSCCCLMFTHTRDKYMQVWLRWELRRAQGVPTTLAYYAVHDLTSIVRNRSRSFRQDCWISWIWREGSLSLKGRKLAHVIIDLSCIRDLCYTACGLSTF